jgi:hypothetical protein
VAEPNRTLTNITPPRVPIIDERTGLISREWYRFFVNLFNLTGGGQNTTSLTDVQVGPVGAAESSLSEVYGAIQGLQLAPVYKEEKKLNYGAFYDTTTQTAAAINTAYAMTFNNTSLVDGVTIGSPTSRVYVHAAGIYNIQFSAQLVKTTGSAGNVYIWPRINGVDVAESSTKVTLAGSNAASVASWNFLFQLGPEDYIELMWSTDDIKCEILANTAAAPSPGIPSIILTVSQVNL